MIMNKKFTMLAASLLFSSAFSVYAQTVKPEEMSLGYYMSSETVDEVKAEQYFLKFDNEYLGSNWESEGSSNIVYKKATATEDVLLKGKEDLKQYLWTVAGQIMPGSKTAYTFTNVETGQQIRFKVTGSDDTASFTLVETAPKSGDVVESLFYTYTATEIGEKYTAASKFTLVGYGDNDGLYLDETKTSGYLKIDENDANTKAESLELVKLAEGISVDVEDLNDLYNSAGFNFNLNDDKLAGVANIFAEKKIVAIQVPGSGKADPNRTGYSFPAGTYFATSAPGNINKTNPSFDHLVSCTFVAVDSDNNIADDADEQKAGKGFTLTEVSGKDLVLYTGADEDYKATGNQISVYNACFTVKESTTSNEVYSLSLNKVRYQEAANAAKQVEGEVSINATKGASALTTAAKGNNFIFKFAESTVKKPIELLKENGASIYNIRLYKANGDDRSRNGKYLTTNATGLNFIAYGKVLANLETPAYQWVISDVDGSNITFKNRETGLELETQLFDEGNGIYSMAAKNTALSYQYYNLEDNGDVELGEEEGTTSPYYFNYSTKIVLEPVENVDNYAGYLNVDDKTVMTLSFGRDIAPTSNKLYPTVKLNSGSRYYFDHVNGSLSNEVADAAQWQLVKSVNNTHPVKYNYAYANGDLVNIKTQGDIVYAYSYSLQLIVDGKVIKDHYLNIGSSTSSSPTYASISPTPVYYYIQENVDGSVSIKAIGNNNKRTASQALLLDGYNAYKTNQEAYTINELKDNAFLAQDIEITSKANDVKTYLIAEAPAISLPANEGHYSFVSETGNYITKDENRDGLAVKEEAEPVYLYVTDKKAVVPSFYVTMGKGEAEGERMFLFCPEDSVDYYVATGSYDKKYQWDENITKAIFKSAKIDESRDTLTTSIKGASTLVAQEANNTEAVEGGLEHFKMQIVEAQDADDMYVVRQVGGDWLYAVNGKLAWTPTKNSAMKFNITGAEAPTANEGVSATEVKVVAYDGAINIKNAAGKNVVISTILGQIVANEVLTSDNATISVPAGIAIVSIDGEEAVKVSVK